MSQYLRAIEGLRSNSIHEIIKGKGASTERKVLSLRLAVKGGDTMGVLFLTEFKNKHTQILRNVSMPDSGGISRDGRLNDCIAMSHQLPFWQPHRSQSIIVNWTFFGRVYNNISDERLLICSIMWSFATTGRGGGGGYWLSGTTCDDFVTREIDQYNSIRSSEISENSSDHI